MAPTHALAACGDQATGCGYGIYVAVERNLTAAEVGGASISAGLIKLC